MPDAVLALAGKGPQEETLRRQAQALGLAGRVRFLGELPDIRSLLGAADVFILPSVAEGMSNALLEAMASGLACVATRIGGNVELMADGTTGELVDVGDSQQLAAAVLRLLADPARAARLGSEAQRIIRHRYLMAEIASRYVDVYQWLLQRRPRPAWSAASPIPCAR
jgi:glycosyltransferase involved in cell wall biosynthesis